MSPGGHLVTTAVACAATGILTGSATLVAGVALGGFFIDVDHAVDYVVFDRQRDLHPGTFLRYYLEGRARRLVLALHSYELFALLGVLAWWSETPWLAGYLLGGLMHLALDIGFNGQLTPRSIWAFYSFTYRARHRFAAPALFSDAAVQPTSERFWKDFFRGTRLQREAGSPLQHDRGLGSTRTLRERAENLGSRGDSTATSESAPPPRKPILQPARARGSSRQAP